MIYFHEDLYGLITINLYKVSSYKTYICRYALNI